MEGSRDLVKSPPAFLHHLTQKYLGLTLEELMWVQRACSPVGKG